MTSNYIVCTWYCVHGIVSLSLSFITPMHSMGRERNKKRARFMDHWISTDTALNVHLQQLSGKRTSHADLKSRVVV